MTAINVFPGRERAANRMAWPRSNVLTNIEAGAPAPQGPQLKGVAMSYIRLPALASYAVAGALGLTSVPAMAGCNSGITPNSSLLSSGDCQADAFGVNATAVGYAAYAPKTGSTMVGVGGKADGNYAAAFGFGAYAIGLHSVSIGAFAGDNAALEGNHRNSAFGAEAGRYVSGGGNTAAGLASGHTVKGDLNSAFGNSAGGTVNGNNNTSGGVLAGHTVNGSYNAAFGDNAGGNVTGSSNIAIGRNAGRNVTASNTVAIGTGARATAGQAVAIGTASIGNVANAISVGSATNRRRIVNVAPGAANSDAATLGQVKNIAAAAAVDVLSSATIAKAVAETPSGDLQRELRQMLGMIKELQQEIADLKGQMAAALDQ
jgi:hypothetical protein